MAIKIISDTSCDLPKDIVEKFGVELAPFGVSYGDEKYYKDYFEITPAEFHKTLKTTNAFPRTSQPTLMEYEEIFRPFLERGDDIICFTITQKFSGSYDSAVSAKRMLSGEYPDRKIVVINSARCTVLQGILVLQACQMRDEGWDFQRIVDKCEEIKDKQLLFVTVDSLEYLQKGGRVGKANALAGSLLNIKPIIRFDDGELHAHSKVRGRKKVVSELINLINTNLPGKPEDYIFSVFCCDEEETAQELKLRMESEHGYKFDYPVWLIGTVVGAHLGPTGLAVSAMIRYEKV